MDFSRATILCIGDVMLDRYLVGRIDRISPEAPVPILQLQRQDAMLGGVGNVARNIVTLGGQAVLVGLVGTDAAGRDVRQRVAAHPGIIDAMVESSSRPTTCKNRIVASRQQVIRVDEETSVEASAEEAQDLLLAVDRHLDRADVVILSDYAKGALTAAVNEAVIARAKRRGVRVLVDPKSRDFTRYRGATCIKPNIAELVAAAGRPLETEAAISAAATELAGIAEADAILVTRAEQGMMLVEVSGRTHAVPSQALEVFDVSGAGDTVMAAFALALASGETMVRAMQIANTAAHIVVGKAGTATVSFEELRHRIESRSDADAAGALVPLATAVTMVERWKASGLTVGFTNGCFDVLHAGHVSLLAEARLQCSRLVVGLNTDASVRRLKGSGRPVNSLADRAAVLGALRDVDLVVAFDEDTPLQLVTEILPDVLVKGADYTIDTVVGADLVSANGGRVHLARLLEARSTTAMIDRMRR